MADNWGTGVQMLEELPQSHANNTVLAKAHAGNALHWWALRQRQELVHGWTAMIGCGRTSQGLHPWIAACKCFRTLHRPCARTVLWGVEPHEPHATTWRQSGHSDAGASQSACRHWRCGMDGDLKLMWRKLAGSLTHANTASPPWSSTP